MPETEALPGTVIVMKANATDHTAACFDFTKVTKVGRYRRSGYEYMFTNGGVPIVSLKHGHAGNMVSFFVHGVEQQPFVNCKNIRMFIRWHIASTAWNAHSPE